MSLSIRHLGAIKRAVRILSEQAGSVPVAGHLVEAAYRRRFYGAVGNDVRLFFGMYPTFHEAIAHIPPHRAVGYDNERSARRVIDEWLEITPNDYPIMFWLSRLLPECPNVFDWGGNVGLKYFAYRRYLPYEPILRWLVCDVPAVVALGRQIAARENAAALHFTTTLEAIDSADLLFAAGSLNFIEDPFGDLAGRTRLPKHLLFSKVPVGEAPSAVTLQNMGTAFCPYHLFNRTEFIERFTKFGYRLVDEWTSPNLACSIPFHPEYSIAAYTGFYFVRHAGAVQCAT